MFKKYIEYIKDNPNGYWFKRKLYGYGWTPATWQGWLIILFFIVFIVIQATFLDFTAQTASDVTLFFINEFFAILTLLLICNIKGEKPKWQWGPPKN